MVFTRTMLVVFVVGGASGCAKIQEMREEAASNAYRRTPGYHQYYYDQKVRESAREQARQRCHSYGLDGSEYRQCVDVHTDSIFSANRIRIQPR